MIDFDRDALPVSTQARIKVIGVGGAGGNTLNYMIDAHILHDIDFIATNTDAQALSQSYAPAKIQLGNKTTKGLGSGANPDIGKKAAEEDLAKVLEAAENADVVFLTGGLGGGTGSGALPVIARALKDRNILTIAVVTKPFAFEGKRRSVIAEKALELLAKDVDTLIVVPNQKLLEFSDRSISLVNAFGLVNEVIFQFVRSISSIILKPGYINVDFADVKAIMQNMGIAVMGTGKAAGKDRAELAALDAISSPLLENVSIEGARSILLNITASSKLGLHEVHTAASIIQSQAHKDASIILGSVIDDSVGDDLYITVIATGFSCAISYEKEPVREVSPAHISVLQEVNAVPVQAQSLQHAASAEHTPHYSLTQHEKQAVQVTQSSPEDLEIPTLLRKMVREKQQLKN
ncbi:MAG: cell division protein FtsZ [Candidatus Babeliaceae bacterium]|nr:cell division protein FtsZ [Candidatus Babeliaceae bacterium]